MTWWIDARDGYVHLMDDGVLVANFLTQDAAEEVLRLQDLCQRQGDLLRGVVNAIRGEPPSDTSWSVHDVITLAERAMVHLNRLGMFAALSRGMLPVLTDTARMLTEDLERFEIQNRKTERQKFDEAKESHQ